MNSVSKFLKKLRVYVLGILSGFFLFIAIFSCFPQLNKVTQGPLLIAFCAGFALLSAAIDESNNSKKPVFKSISKASYWLGLVLLIYWAAKRVYLAFS